MKISTLCVEKWINCKLRWRKHGAGHYSAGADRWLMSLQFLTGPSSNMLTAKVAEFTWDGVNVWKEMQNEGTERKIENNEVQKGYVSYRVFLKLSSNFTSLFSSNSRHSLQLIPGVFFFGHRREKSAVVNLFIDFSKTLCCRHRMKLLHCANHKR